MLTRLVYYTHTHTHTHTHIHTHTHTQQQQQQQQQSHPCSGVVFRPALSIEILVSARLFFPDPPGVLARLKVYLCV